jgi:ribosomal protein L14E/L6E/L27E
MERFEVGMLAVSKAGHDKDILYVIIRAEKEYVYLVDGIIRTLNKPKKKNIKHIKE